jgi:hypothetical protein
MSLLRDLSFALSIGFLLFDIESLRVCGPNEVALHVVDFVLRVHQVLLIFPFNLDCPHHHAIKRIHYRLVVIFFALVFLNLAFFCQCFCFGLAFHFASPRNHLRVSGCGVLVFLVSLLRGQLVEAGARLQPRGNLILMAEALIKEDRV